MTGETNRENLGGQSERPLEGWKEIAAHLGRSVRTARRWDQKEGLPVHRQVHDTRTSVYAFPSGLEAWRSGREPAGSVPTNSRMRWWRPVPAFASIIALAVVVLMAGSGPPVSAVAQAADGTGITLRQAWVSPDANSSGTPSPDGRYLSQVDWDTGDIAILEVATGETRRLTTERSTAETGAYGFSPVWSPDSDEVAYSWNDRELRVAGLDGSPPRVIAGDVGVPLAWFPGGSHLLTLNGRREGLRRFYGIQQVALADGTVQKLRELDRPMPEPPSVSLSPHGEYIAFDSVPQEGSERLRTSCTR